jgi:hypothetical protein
VVEVKTTKEVKDLTTFLFVGRRFSLGSSHGFSDSNMFITPAHPQKYHA